MIRIHRIYYVCVCVCMHIHTYLVSKTSKYVYLRTFTLCVYSTVSKVYPTTRICIIMFHIHRKEGKKSEKWKYYFSLDKNLTISFLFIIYFSIQEIIFFLVFFSSRAFSPRLFFVKSTIIIIWVCFCDFFLLNKNNSISAVYKSFKRIFLFFIFKIYMGT